MNEFHAQRGRSNPFGWTIAGMRLAAEQLKANYDRQRWLRWAVDVVSIAVPGDKLATLERRRGRARWRAYRFAMRTATITCSSRRSNAALARSSWSASRNCSPTSLLAKADNSVLAARLLAPKGRASSFDEFYHGLAVRGNPLYLLTRPGFAAVTLGILLGVGVWTWRQAVFLGPPLVDPEPSRRDIGEYIDAMGDFFRRGPGHRRFLVREVRDGVLQQLCQELKLPPDKLDVTR